ncbi:MAG: helix-turn-helix domain-containing protein, partial [Nannocystaceae bacterium]
ANLSAHVSLVEACVLRPWPGNVRELLGSIQGAARAAVADGRTLVEGQDLDRRSGMTLRTDNNNAERPSPPDEPEPKPRAPRRKAPSREELVAALSSERGNVSRTARALGVHRNSLYRWMRAQGLRPEDYGDGG